MKASTTANRANHYLLPRLLRDTDRDQTLQEIVEGEGARRERENGERGSERQDDRDAADQHVRLLSIDPALEWIQQQFRRRQPRRQLPR